jgi:carboxypeptidase C (cathepsin A)
MIDLLFLRRPFLLLSLALIAKFSFGASPDLKVSEEEGKESPAAQENKGERNDKGAPETKEEKAEKAEKGDLQPSPPVITEHAVALPDGKTLSYKAITGYLLLRDTKEDVRAGAEGEKEPGKQNPHSQLEPPKGKPKAAIFFVAYILNGVADASMRPVTFVFNGGPGAASVWLHLGGLGPRRVLLSDRGETLPPPVKCVDNESTWLDKTDLVFIDPVSTGYSRPVPGEDAKQFHGYKQDIANVGDFIRLWTTRYERWSSPKIIAGESYGTTRAAGLSDYLQDRYGLYVNGIVLISSVLNFQTIDFGSGNDVPFPLYLPTYTATAWYHHKLPLDLLSMPLREVLNRAESFARNDYLLALSQGDALPGPDQDRIANELARLTGLSANYLKQLALRETDGRFVNDLLKDQSRSIGRFDTRFTGIRLYPGTDREEFDPSDEAVNGPFTSAFNDYVRRELKFESDLPYETVAEVNPWTLAENKYLDVAANLKEAMSRNPYLKVWVCCSYFDLATPYFAAESVVHGMNLDPAIRNNIEITFYESGHMVYIDKGSREKFKGDFDVFLDRTLNSTPLNNAGR